MKDIETHHEKIRTSGTSSVLNGRCVPRCEHNAHHTSYAYAVHAEIIKLAGADGGDEFVSRPSFILLHSCFIFHASLVFPFLFPCFPVCVDIHFLLSFRFLPFPEFPSVFLPSPSFRMTCIFCFENIQEKLQKHAQKKNMSSIMMLLLVASYPFLSAVKRTLCRPIRLPMCSANANT